jgi:hypothetical protein
MLVDSVHPWRSPALFWQSFFLLDPPGTPRPFDSVSVVLRNFESIFQTAQLVEIYILTFMIQPILDRVYQ